MSVKVGLDTAKLERTLDELLSLAVAEVGRTLVDIADDAEVNAERKWYTQVRRRTGKTGQLSTELRTRGGVKLEAVVSADEKRAYMVHRPGPLSMRKRKVTAQEYSEIMVYFRANGKLPDGVRARAMGSDGQPTQLTREVRNPLASDGKTLWSQLVIKEGKQIVGKRVDDLDAAMQRAADKLRQR